MRSLRPYGTAVATAAALLFCPAATALSAQSAAPVTDASRRAALAVLAVDVPDWFASAMRRECGGDCRSRASLERFDMMDVGETVRRSIGRNALFDSELMTWGVDGPTMLQAWVAEQVARSSIAYTYDVGTSNIWSVTRLQQRALYQTTTNAAMRDIRTLRGVTGGVASDLVPYTYFAVMSIGRYRDSTYVEKPTILNGFQQRAMYKRTVPMVGALYQLAYADGEAVRQALGEFYCGETADDCGTGSAATLADRRRARAEAFVRYVPPVRLVTTFTKSLEMAVPQSASGTYSYTALAASAIDAWPDFINGNVAELQTVSLVIGTGPIAARIGRKEGAERGKRFAVIRRNAAAGGELSESTVGLVRTVRAPDNRTTAVRRDESGRQVIVQRDSATFKQFHGGSIQRFDVLRERSRYHGALRFGGGAGPAGATLDMQYDQPFDPVNGWHGVIEAAGFLTNAPSGPFAAFGSDSTIVARLGVGLMNEIPIARGNLRVIPQLSAGGLFLFNSATQADDSKKFQMVALAPYLRYGGTVAIGLTPRTQLFGSATITKTFDAVVGDNYTANFSSLRWTDFTTSGSGVGFVFGLRWEL